MTTTTRSSMGLMAALYRELVAAAALLDRHVALRTLVSSDLRVSVLAPGSRTRLPHAEAFNRCLDRYLGGRHFYLPDLQRPTLRQLVRDEFRQRANATIGTDGLDTAFVALRALSRTLADAKALNLLPPSTPLTPRETWTLDDVQLTADVASGVFLVAHPLLEGVFGRSVVVLTEHTLKGSKGYIVNKVSKNPLRRAFRAPSRVMQVFGTSIVRKGGPVFARNAEVRQLVERVSGVRPRPVLIESGGMTHCCTQVLHGRADFGGERVTTTNFPTASDPSLFVGVDLDVAAKAVGDGTAKQTDVVFMSGMSAWSPGQLNAEVKQGSWVPVKAPVSLALNAPAELWLDIMRTIGGEYAEMSCVPSMEEEAE